MRFRYWSEAEWIVRIRERYSIKKPYAATWEEWEELESMYKEAHPIINWLTSDGVDLVQDIVYYVPDKYNQFKQATIWKYFRNLWLFRRCLWEYRGWDHSGLLLFMETCARDMSQQNKGHGHLVRSEDTAKELLVWAELLKRIREDDYSQSILDFVDAEKGEKCIMGLKIVQKPNTLPNYKSKSFYKMRSDVAKNDLRLAGKMFERKVNTWWN